MRTISLSAEAVADFDEMTVGTKRKYYMLGGKGGVGKTSCAASLAVKFANSGHPTIVVSTDPAHSLSDSFAHVCSESECTATIRLANCAMLTCFKSFCRILHYDIGTSSLALSHLFLLAFVGSDWWIFGSC